MNTHASNKLLFSDSMKDFWKEEVSVFLSIYRYVYIIINDVFNIGLYIYVFIKDETKLDYC